MCVPEGVGQHDVRRAVGTVLVGGVEEAAKIGLQAQGVEVIAAGFVVPDIGGFFAAIEAALAHGERRQTIEGTAAIAQVEVVGIGLVHVIIGRAPESVEALPLRDVDGAQDERVHHAEDDGVGADGESERQNSSDGEAGRLA